MALPGGVAGCAATPAVAPVDAGREPRRPRSHGVRVRAGQSSRVNGAAFDVTFTRVAADSRCAKGETCIWEGSATVLLTLTGTDV